MNTDSSTSGDDSNHSSDSSFGSSNSYSSKLGQLVLENTDEAYDNQATTLADLSSNVGRNLNKDYVYEKKYPSLMEAKDGILNREIGAQLWTRSVSYCTQEGDKICYTCRGYPFALDKLMAMVESL